MANEKVMSKTELLTKMQDGWRDFSVYLKTLTEAQMTTPRDAVGWTIKDHLVHIVVWENGISGFLNRESRAETMGIDEATLESTDFDMSNAVIWAQHKDEPLSDVLDSLREAHERLLAHVKLLSDEDLTRSRRFWQPDSESDNPVIRLIMGDSYEHYEEHQPWIDAIAKTPF